MKKRIKKFKGYVLVILGIMIFFLGLFIGSL